MAHGVERVDVSLSLRKWWKLGYTRQNGLVRDHTHTTGRGGGRVGEWKGGRNGGSMVLCLLLSGSCRAIRAWAIIGAVNWLLSFA